MLKYLEGVIFGLLLFGPVAGIALMQPSAMQKLIVPLLILVQMGLAFLFGMAHNDTITRQMARRRKTLERIYHESP